MERKTILWAGLGLIYPVAVLVAAALYDGAPGMPAVFPRWAFGDPRPDFTLVLGNARTGRHVTVDRALVDAIRSDRADEVLKSLDSSYPRHTPSRSGSTTVMVDESGLSVNAVELLGRVFDPRGR